MRHSDGLISGHLEGQSDGERDVREGVELLAWLATYDREDGGYAAARALQERVLETRRRVLGEEHPDTLMAMNNLAATLREQGELERASELQERLSEVRRQVSVKEPKDD